jgi:hypothetical protein
MSTWRGEQAAEEVVMESTAQYWRPVWEALERYWKPDCQKRQAAHSTSGTLHLEQAQSNRGRRGRKKDFLDAERLVKRLVANELVLSFVPDAEQCGFTSLRSLFASCRQECEGFKRYGDLDANSPPADRPTCSSSCRRH